MCSWEISAERTSRDVFNVNLVSLCPEAAQAGKNLQKPPWRFSSSFLSLQEAAAVILQGLPAAHIRHVDDVSLFSICQATTWPVRAGVSHNFLGTVTHYTKAELNKKYSREGAGC